ncbi:hypothetical protein COV04_01245 [Candidatus Uhrbacteria bacterium CG10_big_fil_rev_8_21_14_0_10_48_11]|uniref:Smr domain-containing protein n=1 Tax=Candidatus Uhrbacteria bacterium CG10_big_fil_rev_8_21_14_0_10_48_11 TaxID=1975037 RepID=A0A2M8LFC1_9BACT|nr:MAG: hypothetical protein COV04_01245 [Candidatus Uhrbacteria bacterium CG10_big_fil_rev_8_21_14_0_10_48_11]
MPKPWKQNREAFASAEASGSEGKETDPTAIALLKAELDYNAPKLDLHGQNVPETKRLLAQFIENNAASGVAGVRVIYGVGTGALQDVVFKMLAQMKERGAIVDYASPVGHASQSSTVIVAL